MITADTKNNCRFFIKIIIYEKFSNCIEMFPLFRDFFYIILETFANVSNFKWLTPTLAGSDLASAGGSSLRRLFSLNAQFCNHFPEFLTTFKFNNLDKNFFVNLAFLTHIWKRMQDFYIRWHNYLVKSSESWAMFKKLERSFREQLSPLSRIFGQFTETTRRRRT